MTPGPEMDAAVAERIMGYERIYPGADGLEFNWAVPGRHVALPGDEFRPSTEDGDAFEVVDHLGDEWWFMLEDESNRGQPRVYWKACFVERNEAEGACIWHEATGDTRAEAICRAALAVMEGS